MSDPLIIATTKELTTTELCEIFRHAHWASGRDPVHLEQMIRASFAVVTARRRQRLVGFGRAWGDGVYRVVLDDIVVVPEERGSGVGGDIIRKLLSECQSVEEVSLTCRIEVASFYERFGFRRYAGAHMKRVSR